MASGRKVLCGCGTDITDRTARLRYRLENLGYGPKRCIWACYTKFARLLYEVPPSTCPSPRQHAKACLRLLLPQAGADGEKGHLNCPLTLTRGLAAYSLSPSASARGCGTFSCMLAKASLLGEGWGEGVFGGSSQIGFSIMAIASRDGQVLAQNEPRQKDCR